MRTAALPMALLLMIVASPLVNAGGGHDEGTPEPVEAAHEEAGASSPELLPGTSWSYNLTTEGTFDYHCHPHPWMLAQLRVLPSNGSVATHIISITEPPGEPFENWTFSPKIYDVRVGDTVTWVNEGSVMHRVTQTVGEHIAHVGTVAEADTHDDGDFHADDAAAHAAQPSGVWWIAVAGAGAICVGLFVKGGKKAP